MKKTKAGPPRPQTQTAHVARLQFTHPTAVLVQVAGTFNDWRPESTPMVPLGDGQWRKDLVLEPGIYEYRLVIDGEWMVDPSAAELVPNPFGGMNAVLRVASGTSMEPSSAPGEAARA